MVGLFWGLFTGDYTTSLYIAIFFELFWLDLIPVGTFIPPHLTAATFSALALTTYFGFDHPARIMGFLFASMPLAWLGTKVEGALRERERGSYNVLLNWARKPDSVNTPSLLVRKSLVRSFAMSWVTFFLAILLLKFLFDVAFTFYPSLLTNVDVTWAHLWVSATLGGVMALRLNRVYAVMGSAIGIYVLFLISQRF